MEGEEVKGEEEVVEEAEEAEEGFRRERAILWFLTAEERKSQACSASSEEE